MVDLSIVFCKRLPGRVAEFLPIKMVDWSKKNFAGKMWDRKKGVNFPNQKLNLTRLGKLIKGSLKNFNQNPNIYLTCLLNLPSGYD
jgi:hypothetical protein